MVPHEGTGTRDPKQKKPRTVTTVCGGGSATPALSLRPPFRQTIHNEPTKKNIPTPPETHVQSVFWLSKPDQVKLGLIDENGDDLPLDKNPEIAALQENIKKILSKVFFTGRKHFDTVVTDLAEKLGVTVEYQSNPSAAPSR